MTTLNKVRKIEIVDLEFWAKVPVEGFGHYSVSTCGRVKNERTGRILKPYLNNKGYQRVELNNKNKKTIFVHRLVAMTFLKNTDNKKTVNHKDGNKGDNNISNLEFMTNEENIQHALDTGLNNTPKKMSDKQIKEAAKLKKEGRTYKELGERYGVSGTTVWNHLKVY